MKEDKPKGVSNKFSVAPMMGWTNRHCRYFHRILTEKALLYTEMVTTYALLQGDRKKILSYNTEENPVVLQLGGNNPKDLAKCAIYAEEQGYQGVNLNVGCPSLKVCGGKMGACLMADPKLVARLIQAMSDVTNISVSIKHRIGITGRLSYQELEDFIGTVAEVGCKTFIIHARIAILAGISPKKNRVIPPLLPQWVYQIKKVFPELIIILNGGVNSWQEVMKNIVHTDGVMVGRSAYYNPWLLTEVDHRLYGMPAFRYSRDEIAEAMLPYIEKQLMQKVPLWQVVRHMLGLYYGMPGARTYRSYLGKYANKPDAKPEVLMQAVEQVKLVSGVKLCRI